MSQKMRALLLCIILGSVAAGVAHAQTFRRGSGNVVTITLKQQLNTGLLARTPQERAFNENVVKAVNEGKLPLSMVQSTFLWARNRQPFPMPYFEQALRVRAKKAGLKF